MVAVDLEIARSMELLLSHLRLLPLYWKDAVLLRGGRRLACGDVVRHGDQLVLICTGGSQLVGGSSTSKDEHYTRPSDNTPIQTSINNNVVATPVNDVNKRSSQQQFIDTVQKVSNANRLGGM